MSGKVSLMPHLFLTDVPTRPGVKIDEERFFSFTLNTDALNGKAILRGDRAIAFCSSEFQSDDLVIVQCDGNRIIRYAYKEPKGVIRLESRNPDYQTIRKPLVDLIIEGVVVRIERDL